MLPIKCRAVYVPPLLEATCRRNRIGLKRGRRVKLHFHGSTTCHQFRLLTLISITPPLSSHVGALKAPRVHVPRSMALCDHL